MNKELIDKLNAMIIKYEYEFEQEDIDTLCEAIGTIQAFETIKKCYTR